MKATNPTIERRSPVVVVLGHVDHGKTSLLDWMRHTKVVARESGGITQAVGAYEVVHSGERITFIDTPGHEAFRAMRRRGASIADVAVLVIAADEGVKPQTEESIAILRETKTPFIIAFTKADKPGVNLDKAKNDLLSHEVFLEGYGGDVSYQSVSSVTGEGMNELLDLILLFASVSDLSCDVRGCARGYIVEVKKDSRRGTVVTVVLRDGRLAPGMPIVTRSTSGRVRILEDFSGRAAESLLPSSPGLVIGFEALPTVGEPFVAGESASIDLLTTEEQVPVSVAPPADRELATAVIKADSVGSLEVLADLLAGKVRVIAASAGEVTDGDVSAAISSHALLIIFRTKFQKNVEQFAKNQNVLVFSSEVIYELLEFVEKHLESLVAPRFGARLTVLAIFGSKGREEQVVGGRVTEGVLRLGKRVEISRRGISLGDGRLVNLQAERADVREVASELECGMLVDSTIEIKKGDEISQAAS